MTSPDAPVSETAERFLREVVARIPLERIEELHLFSPLRQGTVETGIAVVAAREVVVPAVVTEPPEAAAPELPLPEAVDDAPEMAAAEAMDDVPEMAVAEGAAIEAAEPSVRHTVYTARYRHVIKGPERGKWEASVKAEAEAPLVTVETVVRGVQRRAGEESEIVRYSALQLARLLRVSAPA